MLVTPGFPSKQKSKTFRHSFTRRLNIEFAERGGEKKDKSERMQKKKSRLLFSAY